MDGAEQIPEDDEVCGFPGAVEEYSEVLVGKNDAFTSLAPGESHTTGPIQFYPNHYFLKDFEVGANYSYQYTGGDISWWDWGTKEVSQVFPFETPTTLVFFQRPTSLHTFN